jgi:hypothetical protein
MAQLVIAAAGAAIGGAIPGFGIAALGLSGQALGWTIGSMIGSAFTPGQKSSGPRLSDLSVSSSAYGTPIPYTQGGPRLAGQIVWASTKREIATTTRQGKGGSKNKVTTYAYEVDLLILLTDNEIPGITRVWRNGKLIWNKSASASAATIAQSDTIADWTRFAVYTGDAAQLPDPTYEAAVGAANAPAYRGRGSLFIEAMQLGSSGNIDNLEFEIGQPGIVLTPATGGADSVTFIAAHSAVVPSERALFVYQSNGGFIKSSIAHSTGLFTNYSVNGMAATHPIIAMLTATKALVTWVKTGSPYSFYANAGDVNGSYNSFSTGADYLLATPGGFGSGLSHIVCGRISDSTGLALWVDYFTKTIYGQVLTVSGTVVGTANPISSASLGAYSMSLESIVMLSPTSAIVVGNITGAPLGTGAAMMAVTISGTTVTFGAAIPFPSQFGNSPTAINMSNALVQVSGGSALCAYVDSNGSVAIPYIIPLTAAGLGTPVQLIPVPPTTVTNVQIGKLSDSLFVASWERAFTIWAMPISASGSPAGEVVQVSATSLGHRQSIAGVSSTKALIAYRGAANVITSASVNTA